MGEREKRPAMRIPRHPCLLVCCLLAVTGSVQGGAMLSKPPSQSMRFAAVKWQGDLDAMMDRRVIRMLVIYNKTFYFVDHGMQRGATYELGTEFEKVLNKDI